MRVGAVNLLVGGGWFSAGDIWPGLRKRGGVVGLPCSVGCNRSLAEFAAIAVGGGVCGAGVGGVCAAAGSGHAPSIAATATPATIGARRRCLPGGGLAPRARTSVTVRVTSELPKPTTVWSRNAARGLFPCGNRAIPARAAELAPMVNGIRTDMVNERLILGPCGSPTQAGTWVRPSP